MYTFDGKIRYSEVDEHGLLRPESLIDYFQDCSAFQSEEGKIGFGYLKDHHIAWIVSYWQIEIRRFPALSEEVKIGTNPYEMKGGFLGLRNFFMDTAEGERLAVANSVWVLMDLARMVPVKEPPEMEKVYRLGEPMEMEYLPRKVQMPKEKESVERIVHEVGETDLDSNHHVNNARYINFAMGLISEDSVVSGIRVEYKKQVLLGDKIHIFTYPDENTKEGKVIPIEMRAEDDSIYCTMEMKVRPRLAGEEDAFIR